MAHITVVGGTGYAGGNIVREAAARGHQVTAVSRSAPADPVEGVTYTAGDMLDPAVLQAAVDDADAVAVALSPRGELEGRLRGVVNALATAVQETGARLGVVGGAGSLLVAEGGPAVADTDGFPGEFKAEAAEMAAILTDLRAWEEDLDWFYLSPAGGFGARVPGEHTGTFRLGGDLLLVDDTGSSTISGADFAHAFVDEIDQPAHRRQRFTVAY